jgi:aminopeptidase N
MIRGLPHSAAAPDMHLLVRSPRPRGARRAAGSLGVAAALALALALAACAGAPPPAALALAPPLPYEAPRVDILDYEVAVDLDHLARQVDGHVDVTFAAWPGRPATELLLDAVSMCITRVSDDQGDDLPYFYDGLRLIVPLPRPLEPNERAVIGIDYHCSPRRGLYFVPPDSRDPGSRWQIWTQGQSQDTRYWVPVWDQLDDRATHTLHATVDGGFITMAAGTLRGSSVDPLSGRRTDTWRMDVSHPISLMTLVAGELEVAELPGGLLPLPVVVEPGALDRALTSLAGTRDALDFIAEYTGRPYPYPKYAQCLVREFIAGGMENISATTLFHELLADPTEAPQIDALDLIVHEAAHMWFGDLVAARDWGHIWLNESLATYVEALYDAHRRGVDGLRQTMLGFQRAAVAAEDEQSRPIVRPWTDPDEMFDDHSYAGGASRLHLLAELLGPEVFQRGVQAYVAAHAEGIVVTDDLQAALEQASGSDLDRFFAQWIFGAGYPRFQLRLLDGADGGPGQARRLLVTQTQGRDGGRPVFRAPVTVAWSRNGVERSRRVLIEQEKVAVELPGDGPLDWVRFDATTTLPARFDLEQDEEMWARQLVGASDGVTRLIAAQWFAGDPSVFAGVREPEFRPAPESRHALEQAARADALPAVRATALRALAAAPDPDDECAALALELARDADPLVRQAAVAALGRHGDHEAIAALLAAVEDRNSSVVAAALGALAEREDPGLLTLCQEVAGRTSQYQLDVAVIGLVASLDDPEARRFLLAAARADPAPAVRAAALSALGGQPDPEDEVWRLAVECLADSSHLVRAAAAGVLGARGDEPSARQLRARLEVECDASVRAALSEALR